MLECYASESRLVKNRTNRRRFGAFPASKKSSRSPVSRPSRASSDASFCSPRPAPISRSSGAQPSTDALEDGISRIEAAVRARLEKAVSPSLVRVLNATGILIHTNLGRAPLSESAITAIAAIARGYSNLELDLATGKRGSRHRHAERLFETLFPERSSLVVNNAAAALMLALNTFALGKEVVISRGELVEIGGSFRVPEILERSGARLREVGTTNKTRLADYAAVIGAETGAILRVHPSNFRVVGFTESAATEDLVRLGRERGLPVIEDFGSGNLLSLAPLGFQKSPPHRRASRPASTSVSSPETSSSEDLRRES